MNLELQSGHLWETPVLDIVCSAFLEHVDYLLACSLQRDQKIAEGQCIEQTAISDGTLGDGIANAASVLQSDVGLHHSAESISHKVANVRLGHTYTTRLAVGLVDAQIEIAATDFTFSHLLHQGINTVGHSLDTRLLVDSVFNGDKTCGALAVGGDEQLTDILELRTRLRNRNHATVKVGHLALFDG